MKMTIVCNTREDDARLDNLTGYGQVYGWHMREALRRAGVEAVLSKDEDLPNAPDADYYLGCSWFAHRFMKANPSWFPEGVWWLESGGPTRSLMTPSGRKIKTAYIGMGADPSVCYPAQDPGKPVVLFNAYNRDIRLGDTGNPRHQACVNALEAIAEAGLAEVWTVKCPLPFASRVVGKFKGDVAGYTTWLDYMSAVRKTWVFLDSTPVINELGRVEASACGAGLLVPEGLVPGEGEGLEYFTQETYREDPEELALLISSLLDSKPMDFEKRATRTLDYFNWDLCAQRLLRALS